MIPGQSVASDRDRDHGSILVLAFLALMVGAVSGLVGALFLLLLERADRFRDALIVWAHSKAFAGFLVVCIACAAGAAVAAWLVRRYSPHASGSGIPHVEAVLNEKLPQAPFRDAYILTINASRSRAPSPMRRACCWPRPATRRPPGPRTSTSRSTSRRCSSRPARWR